MPLQILGTAWSQTVTISVRSGGGPCADPPSAGYGQITWEKVVTVNPPPGSTSETDTATLSLQASPGKQVPAAPSYSDGTGGSRYYYYPGFSCPVAGYHSLDAGVVSAAGPGFGPVQAQTVAAQPSDLGSSTTPVAVSGLSVYRATLGTASIEPGSFAVSAGGGADVGPFQAAVQIGSGIQITDVIAGGVFDGSVPFTIHWTGGDPNTWVTLSLVQHVNNLTDEAPYDYALVTQARASDGTASVPVVNEPPYGDFLGITGPVEVVVEVTPDPSQIPAFSAPGLSLGGQSTWKYTYKFEGVMIG